MLSLTAVQNPKRFAKFFNAKAQRTQSFICHQPIGRLVVFEASSSPAYQNQVARSGSFIPGKYPQDLLCVLCAFALKKIYLGQGWLSLQ